jgi:isopentenyldiphosphate isomerase
MGKARRRSVHYREVEVAERIDIYDANLHHLGDMERIEAHMTGQWHQTFHCWVVSSANGGQVLLQKRSDNMKNFPGLLDEASSGFSWDPFSMSVTVQTFLPRVQRYYLTTLIMAERLLSNAGPLAIS